MKCLSCQRLMAKYVGDFDYTSLAGLRNKTVVLSDVSIYECKHCGPATSYVEISRMADLHRELRAARAVLVKRLWFRFINDEWVLIMESHRKPSKRSKKKHTDAA